VSPGSTLSSISNSTPVLVDWFLYVLPVPQGCLKVTITPVHIAPMMQVEGYHVREANGSYAVRFEFRIDHVRPAEMWEIKLTRLVGLLTFLSILNLPLELRDNRPHFLIESWQVCAKSVHAQAEAVISGNGG